jgi:multiple sugar transport system substrate-binding protein
MIKRSTCAAFAALLLGTAAFAPSAFADSMTMWVRSSGANAAAHLVDLWNSTHPDKIELTTIPDTQMVTKLATGVQAGEVPDLVSFDLIYMPDFMKAGFLEDLTAELKADPDFASVAKAYVDIATYQGKLYGAGFTPGVEQGPLQESGPRPR